MQHATPGLAATVSGSIEGDDVATEGSAKHKLADMMPATS